MGTEVPLAEADPASGRRWNPWDIANSCVVDTDGIGPLTLGQGDSAGLHASGFARQGGRAKMKPTADEIRKVLPPRVTGREARPSEPKHRRKRVAQFDPPTAELMARASRQRRWRGSVADPVSRIHGRPGIASLHPAAGRASQAR